MSRIEPEHEVLKIVEFVRVHKPWPERAQALVAEGRGNLGCHPAVEGSRRHRERFRAANTVER
ncbi:hypothetical protein [Agrobacterium tumefaciens]|uniref:hypothetical protein n=1 Tax=Agrobacterium tumefaciens TaxID=358 RepID=UPI001F47E2F6|nr:hypothetical protein [Agrobacterium tumefaciens]